MRVYASCANGTPGLAVSSPLGRHGSEVDAVVKKILTPTDGSETAKAAVRFAKDIALAENAEVIVLSVVQTGVYGDTAELDVAPLIEPDMRKIVEAEVEDLKAAGVAATGMTVVGDQVYNVIADKVADLGIDLVVMGTHGRSGLARAVIGSVADRVVRHTNVPVVLIPLR